MQPNTLIIGGYGINCEEETQFAFETAGSRARIVHITDLIADQKQLDQYQILAFPGGFSYGDDTGSGNALAKRIRNEMFDSLQEFIARDTLTIGICNGFQVITNLGLLPAFDKNYGTPSVALVHNDSARYIDRWIDLDFSDIGSPWTHNVRNISLPIAHGEGKVYAHPEILARLNAQSQVAARYTAGEMHQLFGTPINPNGSLEDIAAITDETKKILGMMPHPERAIDFTHLPHWSLLQEQYRRRTIPMPTEGPGLQIFKNGVTYFQ